MNDSFDKKIKEALENFEMPYDANAWAELEKQLPTDTAAASNNGSSATWKWVGAIAVIATLTTVAILNQTNQEKKETALEELNINAEDSEKSADKKPVNVAVPENVVSEQQQEDKSTDIQEGVNIESNAISKPAEIVSKSETSAIPSEPQSSVVLENPGTKNVEEAPIENKKETPESFTVAFETSKPITCANEDVNFISNVSADDAELTWNFGDGNASTEPNPTHNYVNEGSYMVTLIARSGSSVAEETQKITVRPTPSPVLSAERKLNGYEAIPLYLFTTATQPNETATWKFSDGSIGKGNRMEHLFRNSGEQKATLTLTNNYGCSMSIDRKYQLDKFNLLAPTAFTPDGDGMNETFIPKALPEMGIAFEMTIQDPRTGQLVYRTEDAQAPWNGTLNNSGVELDNGVYIWTVVLKEDIVKNRVFTETINLQR